jgi:hypothetical protein
MTMTGAALLLAGGRALAQSASDQGSTEAKVVRIYATADGGSRVEELTISPDAKPIDITRMTASVYRGSGARAPDWHTAPACRARAVPRDLVAPRSVPRRGFES